MENKMIMNLIMDRVALATHTANNMGDEAVTLDRETLADMLFQSIRKEPSFHLDDIIEEAEKVGITADEVYKATMEVWDSHKSWLELMEIAPDYIRNSFLDKMLAKIIVSEYERQNKILN